MPKYKIMKISKGNLHAAYGMKANKLSAFLQFSKGQDTYEKGEKPSQEVVMPMLRPLNISYVNAFFDDTFFTTTLLTDSDNFLYYGEDEDFVSIKQTDINDITELMNEIVCKGDPATTTSKISFTENSFWTFICLMDLFRRRKLESLILHLIDTTPIMKKDLENEFELAKVGKDLRWLTPFAMDTFVFDGKPDFEKGLKELSGMGFVQFSGTEIGISKERLGWSVSVSECDTYLGLKSLFYQDKGLKVMGTLFLRIGDYLYLIEGSNNFSWVGIDRHQFTEAICTILAPGDINDLTSENEKPAKEAMKPKQAKTAKFCRYCGTELTLKSNFCKNCGKPVK